jgi:hypothetical protein
LSRPVSGRFTAACDDSVGIAHGACLPGLVHMRYRFRLKLKSRTLVVSMDDRIIPTGADRALNRATVRKWGVRLGEVALVLERRPAAAADRPMPNRPGA